MNTTLPSEVTATVAERILEVSDMGDQVLLAIDTALGSSVAVGIGTRIYEVCHDDPRGHAEAIGVLLARVFAYSGVSATAVTGVVAGIGPGPFTGLRVGISAAKAFAVGRGVPLLPLQGHEAVVLAAAESGTGSTSGAVRVVQDAKRRELFVTDYEGVDADGIPVRVAGPSLMMREGYEPVFSEMWPERIPAARLVQLAARRFASGRDFEADRALYLRAPDVAPPKTGLIAVAKTVSNDAGEKS